jgi:hypothetical protein
MNYQPLSVVSSFSGCPGNGIQSHLLGSNDISRVIQGGFSRTVARIFPTKVCRKRQALVGNDKHLEVAGTHRLSRTSKSYCYRQGDNEPGYGRMIAVLSTNNKYCTGNIYDLTDRRIAHEAHSEFGATTTCGNPGPKRVRAAIRKMTFFRKPRYT